MMMMTGNEVYMDCEFDQYLNFECFFSLFTKSMELSYERSLRRKPVSLLNEATSSSQRDLFGISQKKRKLNSNSNSNNNNTSSSSLQWISKEPAAVLALNSIMSNEGLVLCILRNYLRLFDVHAVMVYKCRRVSKMWERVIDLLVENDIFMLCGLASRRYVWRLGQISRIIKSREEQAISTMFDDNISNSISKIIGRKTTKEEGDSNSEDGEERKGVSIYKKELNENYAYVKQQRGFYHDSEGKKFIVKFLLLASQDRPNALSQFSLYYFLWDAGRYLHDSKEWDIWNPLMTGEKTMENAEIRNNIQKTGASFMILHKLAQKKSLVSIVTSYDGNTLDHALSSEARTNESISEFENLTSSFISKLDELFVIQGRKVSTETIESVKEFLIHHLDSKKFDQLERYQQRRNVINSNSNSNNNNNNNNNKEIDRPIQFPLFFVSRYMECMKVESPNLINLILMIIHLASTEKLVKGDDPFNDENGSYLFPFIHLEHYLTSGSRDWDIKSTGEVPYKDSRVSVLSCIVEYFYKNCTLYFGDKYWRESLRMAALLLFQYQYNQEQFVEFCGVLSSVGSVLTKYHGDASFDAISFI